MKFRIESRELKRVAGWTRAISEKSSRDIVLGFVLIEVAAGVATFRGTDRRIEIETRVDAHVESTGRALVSAEILNEFARRLPDGSQVTFECEQGDVERLSIHSNRTRATFPMLPGDSFPRMSSDDFDATFSMEGEGLGRLFDRSQVAACLDESRQYLCGVFLDLAEQQGENDDGVRMLRGVATDGFRMSIAECVAPSGLTEMASVIIPLKTVSEVSRIFSSSASPVEVSVSEGKIRFSNQATTLTSRLVHGSFPDYAKFIPRELPLTLTADPHEFREALLRVSVVADMDSAVLLELGNDRARLSVNERSVGRANEELDVTFPHPEYSAKFRCGHFLAFLDKLGDGPMAIELPAKPGSTLITTESDPGLTYLMMPMRD